MRVDERRHRGGSRDRRHRIEHRRGEAEIEQRVDEERDAVADDQTGVAPTPPAIGLQVRVQAVTDLVEAERVRMTRCHLVILAWATTVPPSASRATRRSASIVVGRWVLASGIDGNTEASHTWTPLVADRPWRRRRRPFPSRTCPSRARSRRRPNAPTRPGAPDRTTPSTTFRARRRTPRGRRPGTVRDGAGRGRGSPRSPSRSRSRGLVEQVELDIGSIERVVATPAGPFRRDPTGRITAAISAP